MDQNKNNPKTGGGKPGGEKRPKNSILISLIIAVAIVVIIGTVYNIIASSQYTQTTYSEFLDAKASNNIAEAHIEYETQGVAAVGV